MPNIWKANEDAVRRAAQKLARGHLIAIPTETVYGLAADASDDDAVASIFALKGRPSFNPLIVHVLDAEQAETIVEWTEQAARLAEAFWPGGLTLVLPLRKGAPLAARATGGLTTVAVRSPAHPVARAVLTALGRPFVAPSANRSGRISPTTAAHVADEFSNGVSILDGGACRVGVESTIIGLTGSAPTLLRPGGITKQEIESALSQQLVRPQTNDVTAPGMLSSHYAPQVPVRLNAQAAQGNEVLLGFGPVKGASLNLSPTEDLAEAAAALFSHLRQLDVIGRPIAVSPIPTHGLGAAINDRLARAAAPRPD